MFRVWDKSSMYVQPTVHVVNDLIASLSTCTDQPLDFVLDLHASNSLLGFYVVGNSFDSVFRLAFIGLNGLIAYSQIQFVVVITIY